MENFEPSERENGNASMEPTAGNTPAPNRRLTPGGSPSAAAPATGPTLLAWPRLDLGQVLRPLSPDDDLLEEMHGFSIRCVPEGDHSSPDT